MSARPVSDSITIRATLTSYLALSGIWVVLTLVYSLPHFRNHGDGSEFVALLTGGISLLWWIWLRGFKITVSGGIDGFVEYRDGLFRSSKVYFREIGDVKNKSIEWNVLTRKIRIPRIVVTTKSGEIVMLINPKPFGRNDIQNVLKKLNIIHRGNS